MKVSSGELYLSGNTTPVVAAHAAAIYKTGYAARGAQKGDGNITEDATAGTLTCLQGRYLVNVDLTVETEDLASTSGADDAGIITFEVRKDGAAVGGLKGKVDFQDSDRPGVVSVSGLVDVGASDSGVLAVYVSSGDADGNDIRVTEGSFNAVKLS